MAVKTQPSLPGEFILSEDPGTRSRENVTILANENPNAGDVMNRKVTAGTIASAADAGNTGDGTSGTESVGAEGQVGVYVVTFIEPGTNLGDFQVEDPHGRVIGTGVVGTAFSDEIVFTIADGATDFVAGDVFRYTVTALTEKWQVLANDGSERADGVVLADVTDTADADGVMVVRDVELNTNEVNWPSGISAVNKAVAIGQLEALGILLR